MQLTFAEFEAQLNYVLLHLYDPSLRPSALFWEVIGHTTDEGLDVMQTAIIQEVEDLRPADYVPKSARAWRVYGILYYRFVSNLIQEDVADRVGITPRHLRREQAGAIRVLALKLWEKAQLPIPDQTEKPVEPEEGVAEHTGEGSEAPTNPELQLQNDLLALQESAPGVISDIIQVIQSVLTLAEKFPGGKEIHVERAPLPAELKGAIHPSALRQVLWMIVRQAIEQHRAGELSIQCGKAGDKASIEISFSPSFTYDEIRIQTIGEILEAVNGTLTIRQNGDSLAFRIEFLNVDRTVLVVDDNPDIVHLYQRYLVGTQYHLVHLAKGQEVFDGISEIRPDIIVLDIMLPDVDGWDLLTRLTEHPETRGIPVIVCSVVSDPDLTRALGARASLSKPVQRQEFIRSLDQVSSQA
jgi:CheY-like chemotaxis protein